MRVKKLEIFGFKSFALKQAITFGDGVTGIVGPNGCGKSNVVDAMRWVMGEQNARHLRGGNMQDIIFCGSEKKAPLGFAEVTLTIDNAHQDAPLEYNHFQEIEITRRLYKTGESEYEINRQKARLKDIADFFLGTGVGTKAYSIIEQGRVNEIISAKPTDRRLIIEEAAGITKYKAKKALAERRMESTRTNLNRIVDIKNEVDKRVATLLKEKEKLEKVEALKKRIRDIDLHVATHHFLSHQATLSHVRNEHDKTRGYIDEIKREFAVREHGFSKVLSDYSKTHDECRLLENLETQHKTTLELAKKDLAYAQTTESDNRQLLARLATQLLELDQRKAELEKDIATFRQEKAQCEEDNEKLTILINSHQGEGQEVVARRQKNVIEERDTQRRIVEAASRAARLQSEITVLRDQEQQQKQDALNLEYEIRHKASELVQGESRLAAFDAELNQGAAIREELSQKIAKKTEEHKAALQSLTAQQKQLASIEEERVALASRLRSLVEIAERCEWSESGIGEILASEHKTLVKGVLAEIIRVKPGCEDTVERCLAHILDAAILKTNDDLEHVARFLKQNKLPETAFFLLNDKLSSKLAKPLGLKSLADIITVDEKFAALTPYFERFFLAENLTVALTHWPAAQLALATIISEQGEMLLPDGRAIVLAHDNGKGVFKRKNEIAELEKKLTQLEAAKTEHETRVQIAVQHEKDIKLLEESLQQEMKTLAFGLVRLEETVKQKRLEFSRLEAEHKRLIDKRDDVATKCELFDEKMTNLNKQWSQALDEHKNHEETLEQLRLEKADVDATYDAFQQKMRELEIEKVAAFEKTQRFLHSLTEAQKNLTHVEMQKKSFTTQSDEKAHEELVLNETIRQNEKKLVDLAAEIEKTTTMLASARQRCDELSRQKEAEEKHLDELSAREQAQKQKLHALELTQNTAENHCQNTEDRIKEKYRLNLRDHLIDFHLLPLNENKANLEKNDLIKTKERLGSVNENASKEYDEFFDRSQFLHAQVDDLNDGLVQLEDAIKKINKTTKMRFMDAFQSINSQFSKVFPRLFNGGKAELVLCDEEDLLNCGIDIIAKPPGKNIGSIELMSGGEKALTAISLIMAIFLIKPSPFCLLDEVDAPLDEANVARFSQLIKEMSQLSQFIVITHNRKTMESADQLYGVTMEDAGLSKIVSVHVQQAFDALKTPLPKSPDNSPKKATQLFLDDSV